MQEPTQEQLAQIQQQCIFCQIASGKVASKKVYEDEHVVAVLDINPANPGHLLVITKKHFFVMPQIPDDLVEHIGMVSKQLSQVLLKTLKAEGTNIFVANGVVAGQRAQHFMLHIIPRMDKDGVGLTVSQREIGKADFDKIHKALLEGVSRQIGEGIVEAEEVVEEKVKKKSKKKKKVKKKKKEEVEEKEDAEEKEEDKEKGGDGEEKEESDDEDSGEKEEDAEKEEEDEEKVVDAEEVEEEKKVGLDDIARVLGK